MDSREVAIMVGKEHKELLVIIGGQRHKDGRVKHAGCLPSILENGLSNADDYFVKSTYTVMGNSKIYPCFLITEKGCGRIALKLKAGKGSVFAAIYTEKFKALEAKQAPQEPQAPPKVTRKRKPQKPKMRLTPGTAEWDSVVAMLEEIQF